MSCWTAGLYNINTIVPTDKYDMATFSDTRPVDTHRFPTRPWKKKIRGGREVK
jgi:hypothetical protein